MSSTDPMDTLSRLADEAESTGMGAAKSALKADFAHETRRLAMQHAANCFAVATALRAQAQRIEAGTGETVKQGSTRSARAGSRSDAPRTRHVKPGATDNG